MAGLSVGSIFLLPAGTAQVIRETEKAVQVETISDASGAKKIRWIPKSGLVLQKRSPLIHHTTPDTYKIAQWVN